MFPGTTVHLHKGAHIGHGAIIHGATIGKNCLVGLNSVLMDNVMLGEECIVGALTLITADTIIPKRKIVVGNPGKIVKDVSDKMIEWKTKGTELYQQLPKECFDTLKACEPDRHEQPFKPEQQNFYKTWKKVIENGRVREKRSVGNTEDGQDDNRCNPSYSDEKSS